MESLAIEKQIEGLSEWIKSNPDPRELKRALAVKLVLQGWAYKAIAEALNVSISFISKWNTLYKTSGISRLKLSYKGAKSYLTSENRQEVIEWLKSQSHWYLSRSVE